MKVVMVGYCHKWFGTRYVYAVFEDHSVYIVEISFLEGYEQTKYEFPLYEHEINEFPALKERLESIQFCGELVDPKDNLISVFLPTGERTGTRWMGTSNGDFWCEKCKAPHPFCRKFAFNEGSNCLICGHLHYYDF